MGGDSPPKNTAEVIDLDAASPSWRAVSSMQFGRRHQSTPRCYPTARCWSPAAPPRPASTIPAAMWMRQSFGTRRPKTGRRSPAARGSPACTTLRPSCCRMVGSSARAVTGSRTPRSIRRRTSSREPRPTITSAPPSVAYGQSFFVGTPNAATISKITMLRLSSVTHAFNQSQYINELSFSQTTGGLNVTAPPNSNVAPPGYYLLFLLNGSGVPSVARIIQLGGTAPPSDTTPPTVSITAPATGATVSGTAVTVLATAADNVGVAGVQFKLDGRQPRRRGHDRPLLRDVEQHHRDQRLPHPHGSRTRCSGEHDDKRRSECNGQQYRSASYFPADCSPDLSRPSRQHFRLQQHHFWRPG